MRDAPRIVVTGLAAAVLSATLPPLGMVALWAVLSGSPARFLAEIGAGGIAGFVASEQRFFLPVALAGLAAHAVLFSLHRTNLLLYAVAFYCIGAVVYAVGAMPQLAAFTLDAAVVRTLAFDALAWWGPMAALSGLVFWAVAGRRRRRRRRRTSSR